MFCFLCHITECSLCLDCRLLFVCEACVPFHKSKDGSYCYPFIVLKSDTLGRHIVALRDIEELEIVVEDIPVAVGPLHVTDPMCLECHTRVGPEYFCECGFPMCDSLCAQGENHRNECKIYREAGVRVQIKDWDEDVGEYKAIMVLRLLCLDAASLTRVELLCDHVESLTENEENVYTETVVNFIRDKLKQKMWSKEQILRMVGIIRSNAFQMSAGKGKGNIRALLPTLSTFNHSCMANTRVFERSDHSACVRAKFRINKGDEISLRYTEASDGVIERREKIRDNWNFECICPRCLNVRDLCDALLCPMCGEKMLQQALGFTSPWACKACDNIISREEVKKIEKKIRDKIERNTGDKIPYYENLMIEIKKEIHPNHHLMVVIWGLLIKAYGKMMRKQESEGKAWSLKNVRRQVKLCHDALVMLERIDPGFSEEASKIITEYTAPRLMLIQFDYQKGKMAVAEAKGQMELLLTDMRKSVRDSEIVMENTDMAGLKRAKALLNDGQLFYEEILNKNRLEKQKQKQKEI